ncbi:hypothetical protein [Glutamicibacter sp.]|uniref:hypothetical protein n=1 Tax=Glutamicibacter sp. TaxID=1931995 RepID=UPI0028BEB3D2|nr:hypothetical protein [Glutamicibacter sp.]
MRKINGRILIIAPDEVAGKFNRKNGKRVSEPPLDVEWKEYPKSDCATQIQQTVQKWANHKYRGSTVYVDQGTMREKGVDGVGKILVNGIEFAEITAFIPTPKPVEALTALDGDPRER